MNTKSRKTPLWLLAGLLGLILLTTMACAFGGMTIGANSATIDLTLNEDQVNQLLTKAALTHEDQTKDLLETTTSVEMLDGFIRVHGTATNTDGAEVEGSYDVSVGVKDDILLVKIIDVNIPGVDMTDPRIVDANQKLAEELTKSVTQSNGEVLYKEASVQDGVLKMKIQVKLMDK